MIKYQNLRKQVLDAILEAVDQGLITGTSGNIALRDDNDDVVAITPSGIPYKGMTVEDIAIIDLHGKWLEGTYKPSSEWPMHTAVLRARRTLKQQYIHMQCSLQLWRWAITRNSARSHLRSVNSHR